MAIMKKNYALFALLLILASSCEKQGNEIYQFYDGNSFVPVIENSKASSYNLSVRIGHPASGCNGCVKIDGVFMHVDCQGGGSSCGAKAAVRLSPDSAGFYTVTTIYEYELTSEDFFLMPDRSLYVGMDGKDEIWLNIPAQLSTRDITSEQFSFYGLFYSNYVVYKNQ